MSECHWDDEIDRWETALANAGVLSKPTHIKSVLLIRNARMISIHQSPMGEDNIRVVQTFPFFGGTEMSFELVKYILLKERPQKFLLVNRE